MGATVAAVLATAGAHVLIARGVEQTNAKPAAAAVYYCPMDPEVESDKPGTCPKCGMTLVKRAAPAPAPRKGSGRTATQRPYVVNVTTTPSPPRPGEPAHLRLKVHHPRTNALVNTFAIVHERPYHLFVLSLDLEYFEHLHPEHHGEEGALVAHVTLPRPGYYKLYSDFLPEGGKPQVVVNEIVTTGPLADRAASRARLVPDTRLAQTLGDMTLALELPAGGLVAGRQQSLTIKVTDADGGAPVRNLEPYLGAFGHSLLISEDTEHYVHTHPAEHVHPGARNLTGGPTLTFKAILPEPGRYRLWTQVKRGGVLSTARFTIAAGEAVMTTSAPPRR
jgi:hypothetical protein